MNPMKTVVPRKAIIHRCVELGREIRDHYGNEPFTALWIASGAMFFTACVIPHIKSTHVRLRSLVAKSYAGTKSTGHVHIIRDRVDIASIQNRRVLIIDDILDTGATLTAVRDQVETFGAAEIKTCVLLRKPGCQLFPIEPDYVGFPDIPNVFVVGFGLDYRDHFRELRYIAELDAKNKAEIDALLGGKITPERN